jgi:glyoxylase-like metal-dependent hydrolase (beta-lactamase superfamily II)
MMHLDEVDAQFVSAANCHPRFDRVGDRQLVVIEFPGHTRAHARLQQA